MAKGKIKFEKPWISFLNPFNRDKEAKIWLFNLYIYNGEYHSSVTIDILNITIVITWRRIEQENEEEV